MKRHFDITDKLIPWPGGTTARFESAIDITERIEAETELKHSRHMLKTVLDTIPARVFWKDNDLKYLGGNHPFARDAGLKEPEDLIGKTDFDLAWKKTAEAYRNDDRAVIQSGEPRLNFEEPQVYEDGTKIWLRTSKVPLKNSEGKIIGLLGTYDDITREKDALAALRESEERYGLAAKASNLGVWDWYTKSDTVYYSDVWKAQLGYFPDEIENSFASWQRLLHPDDYARMQEAVTDYLTNPAGTFEVEFRLQHKDGSYRWIYNRAESTKDKNGRVIRMFGVHTDITDRKNMEIELRVKEALNQTLLNAPPDSVILLEKDGTIAALNDVGARRLGGTPDEIKGKNAYDLIPQNNAVSRKALIDEVIRTGTANEVLDHRGDYWFDNRIFPIFEEDGKTVKQVAIFAADISRQKELEKEVFQREEQYRKIFESVTDSLIVCNVQGNIVDVNSAAQRMYGYSFDEMTSMNPAQLIHQDYHPMIEKMMDTVLNGDVFEGETVDIRKSGEKINTSVIATISSFHGKKHILVVIRDVTRQKNDERKLKETMNRLVKANDELKELTERLKESNRELEQFAYVASHDLQEPLRKVRSFTELLEERYRPVLDAKGIKYMHYVTDGAGRMQRLIEDLLKFSRVSTRGKPFEAVDMQDLTDQIVDNMSVSIEEKGAGITVGDLPVIRADRTQMLQMMQNLIQNALKFSRENTPPEISISADETDKEWVFRVRDNGIGIDPQFSERIFVIFQRLHTRDKYSGTGIGLAVCRKIAERHDGTIYFKSDGKSGTEFVFTISKKLKNIKMENK